LEPNSQSLQKTYRGGLPVMVLFSTKNSHSQTKVHTLNKGV
jgi:hypothetical protein